MGRTKPVRPNLDALFALPSAAETLQVSAGLILSGHAGVCWMPPAGQSVTDVEHEIEQLLDMPGDDTDPAAILTAEGAASAAADGAAPAAPPTSSGTGALKHAQDSYGYQWLLLDDGDVGELVTRVHLVNSTLAENGWGPQLLVSVFSVVPGPDADSSAKALYLVYLYKRGTFYPFAPTGKERRDNELELRIRSQLGGDLPIENDISRWFPLWDIPVPLH